MKIDGFDQYMNLSKENAEALVKSGNVAMQGFEEYSKVIQGAIARSTQTAEAAAKALAGCKSPVEIADIQGKLARESIETAISESRKLAEIGQAMFTAALEPLNARFGAFQAMIKTAA